MKSIDIKISKETYKQLKNILVELFWKGEIISTNEDAVIQYLITYYLKNNKNEKTE